MCDRECICKSCINGGCGACDHSSNTVVLSQCHHTGVKNCGHHKKNTWWRKLIKCIDLVQQGYRTGATI